MGRKQTSSTGLNPESGSARKPLFLLAELRTPPFPSQVRVEGGTLLSRVQDGERLTMPNSRPMPTIGPGVHELRLADEGGDWRIIYRIEADLILLVDAFKKTTAKTNLADIRRSKNRLTAHDARVAAAIQAAASAAKKFDP